MSPAGRLGLALAAIAAVVLVAEWLSPGVVERRLEAEVEACLPVEQVRLTEVPRPFLLALATPGTPPIGLVVDGAQVSELRLERTELRITDERLLVRVELLEADVQARIAGFSVFGATPALELRRDVVVVGLDPIPARVQLRAIVRDGQLRFEPGDPVPSWFQALGLSLALPVPDEVQVDEVVIDPGRATIRATIELPPDGAAAHGPSSDPGALAALAVSQPAAQGADRPLPDEIACLLEAFDGAGGLGTGSVPVVVGGPGARP